MNKAEIYNAFILFVDGNAPEPGDHWDGYLDAYGQLPAGLKDGMIPAYLRARADKDDKCYPEKAKKLRNLDSALTLEEMDLAALNVPGSKMEMRHALLEAKE